MKFDISKYGSKHVMLCPDQESASIFMRFLDSIGRTWCSGTSYLHRDNWNTYKRNTCYRFTEGEYCRKSYFEENHYIILNFYDFEWDELAEPTMTFEEAFYGVVSDNQTTI